MTGTRVGIITCAIVCRCCNDYANLN